MNQIYLLRHGIAVPHGDPDYAERDRPLTPKGEKRIRQIAGGLLQLELELDAILSSPLTRAWRTAEIVAEVLGESKRLERADELAADNDALSIQDWLGTRREQRLMLVGHNPSLSDLVSLLIGLPSEVSVFELRKGGIAALSGQWGHPMRLDWLGTPRLLRNLAED